MINETESAVPVNQMGASSSTAGTGGIDTFDPKLGGILKRKQLKDIIGITLPLKKIRGKK